MITSFGLNSVHVNPVFYNGMHNNTNTLQCFHNSKIHFLEWTLKFPGIYRNFLELKKAKGGLLDAAKRHNLHNIYALLKIIVHGLGVGPSIKCIEIGLCFFKP